MFFFPLRRNSASLFRYRRCGKAVTIPWFSLWSRLYCAHIETTAAEQPVWSVCVISSCNYLCKKKTTKCCSKEEKTECGCVTEWGHRDAAVSAATCGRRRPAPPPGWWCHTAPPSGRDPAGRLRGPRPAREQCLWWGWDNENRQDEGDSDGPRASVWQKYKRGLSARALLFLYICGVKKAKSPLKTP